MQRSTRRGFLLIAGAGAAMTAGAAAVATAAGAAGPADTGTPAPPAPTALPATAAGTLVAYVKDVRSGRVSVMVGESEVVLHDPDLVARLAHAATGKKA